MAIRKRQMDGFVFHHIVTVTVKKVVQKLAQDYRDQGNVARVIKDKYGWGLWVAPGSERNDRRHGGRR